MVADIWGAARKVDATAGVANRVAANRAAWLSAVSHSEAGIRAAWLPAASPEEGVVRVVWHRADAYLAIVMPQEVSRAGEWLGYPAERVCSQAWLRAVFSLRWVASRVRV